MQDRESALPERLSLLLHPRGGAKRALGRIAAALGLTLVFVGGLLVGTLLHLDSRPMRRVVRSVATRGLATLFRGKIVVGEIDAISLRGVRIRDAQVLDPAGRQVISAHGIVASMSTRTLLASLWSNEGPVYVRLPRIQIEEGTVTLIESANDVAPSIGDTFTLRSTSPPTAGAKPRPVSVLLPRIELGHVVVEGSVARPLDAELHHVVGQVLVVDDVVSVDVEPTGLVDRAYLPAKTDGTASYHLRVDTNAKRVAQKSIVTADGTRIPAEPTTMWMDFTGLVGAVSTTARCDITGSHLSGTAFLQRVSPEAARALLPSLPLLRTADVSAKIEGGLPDLAFEATVEIPQGAGLGVVTTQGRLLTSAPPKLEASFETSEIDPRDFLEGLPDARVNARGRVTTVLDGDDPRISVEIATLATTADGVVVPAVDAVIDFVAGGLSGSATVHEPGIPTDTRFDVDASGKVHFGLIATTEGLDRAPRIGALASGAGTVDVRGTLDGGRVSASVSAHGAGLRVANVSAHQGVLKGTLEGTLADLRVRGDASLDDVRAQDQAFDHVVVKADGPIMTPFLELAVNDQDLGQIDAKGTVSVPSRSARDVSFHVARQGVVAEGRASRIGVSDAGAITAEGVAVSGEGLGKLGGSLQITGNDVVGKLKADGIDLDKLGRLVGSPIPLGGIANVDVDLEKTAHGRKGHVEVELEEGEALAIGGISARLSAQFDGENVETSGYVRLVATATDEERAKAQAGGLLGLDRLCDGTIAEVRIAKGQGQLVGPLLGLDTWKRFVGAADVAAENWNLRCLAERVPFGLPVSEAAGLVTMRVHVARREGDAFPSLEDVYARTHGLSLVGARSLLGEAHPWESSAIDGQLTGSVDGRDGHVEAHVILFDGSILGDLDASTTFDLKKLLGAPAKGEAPVDRVALLRSTPIEATFGMPRRAISELSTLPTFLRDRIPALDGDVRLDVEAHGTVDEPFLYVSAQGFHVAPRASMGVAESWAPPLDATVVATYESDDGKAVLDAHFMHEGATVATIDGGVEVEAKDLTHPSDDPLPWTGGLLMTFYDLPLGSIPALADRDVSGPVDGTLSLSGLNASPKLDLDLTMPFMRLGELYFDGHVIAHVAPKPTEDKPPPTPAGDAATEDARAAANGTFEIDLDGQDGGQLQVLAYAGMRWEGLTVPLLDPSSSGGLALSAKAFRLGAAFPLVSSAVSKLDGLVDGTARLDWGRVSDVDQGHIDGFLKVRDAVVFIPQFGQELRKGKASIIANPAGVVRIEGVEAGGITGRVHGNLLGRFDGLKFRSASGEVVIDEGQEIPITFEGVPVGAASGQVKLDASYDGGELAVHAKVPQVKLALPSSSSRGVQDLGDDPTIKLSAPLGPPQEPRAKDALRYALTVDLQRAQITGSGLEAVVHSTKEAPIRLKLAEDAKVSGDIVFDRGYVVLQQKKFEVDNGLVRLREEAAANPFVNLTAHWEGTDGGRVYVDYVGNLEPITDDKIRFRSDPPRSKQDIIATLLFGTDLSSTPENSGQAQSGDKSVAGIATEVGGSVASQALNALLSSRYVTLTVDRGTDGGLRGKVEWRATEGLTFGLSGQQVQAQPSSTTTSTATAPSATNQGGAQGELSLDWHFLRNWSLRSTVGAGVREPSTGIDVLWQYRY